MLRADCGIAPGQKIDYIVKSNSPELSSLLKADTVTLVSMLKAKAVTIDEAFTPQNAMPSALTPIGTLYMPVEGLIDVKAEATKLTNQLAELGGHLDRANQKLSNQAFISKAKPEVVAQFEKSRQEIQEKFNKVKHLLEMLG